MTEPIQLRFRPTLKALRELYRLKGARLQNKPTEPPKSRLNGKKEALNGEEPNS